MGIHGGSNHRFYYSDIARVIVGYEATPQERKPSQEQLRALLFPQQPRIPPSAFFQQYDFDTDGFTREWLANRYENLHTHDAPSDGIDVVGWKPSPLSTPEHPHFSLFFIEVKGNTRDARKSLNSQSTRIKVKYRQLGFLQDDLAQLRAELPFTQTIQGVPYTISSAHGYVACMYVVRNGHGPEVREVYFMRPSHIRGEIPLIGNPGWKSSRSENNYPHYPVDIQDARKLVSTGALVQRVEDTRFVVPEGHVMPKIYAPPGASLPTEPRKATPERERQPGEDIDEEFLSLEMRVALGDEPPVLDDVPF